MCLPHILLLALSAVNETTFLVLQVRDSDMYIIMQIGGQWWHVVLDHG